MKKEILKVKEFHNAFGVENGFKPTNIEGGEVQLRCKLLYEELKEYEVAAMEDDLVEVADALADQLYIIFGTILKHGMQNIIEEVFDEVQRSNMSKLGADGLPVINGVNGSNPDKALGKILKGENYSEPNIKKILEKWM